MLVIAWFFAFSDDYKQYSDEELWDMYLGGNQNALWALYFRYMDGLNPTAMKILKDWDEAKGAVIEVFIKLWEKKQSKPQNIPGYLATLVWRYCLNKGKRERKGPNAMEQEELIKTKNDSASKDETLLHKLDDPKKLNQVIQELAVRANLGLKEKVVLRERFNSFEQHVTDNTLSASEKNRQRTNYFNALKKLESFFNINADESYVFRKTFLKTVSLEELSTRKKIPLPSVRAIFNRISAKVSAALNEISHDLGFTI